jgi:hypothetical protein
MSNIKTMVRGAYDIQKLRIMTGNRLVGNFKAKLGQEPGEGEETLDEKSRTLLAQLRKKNDKITTGVVDIIDKDNDADNDAEGEEVPGVSKKAARIIADLLDINYRKFTTKAEGIVPKGRFTGNAVISDYTELCLLDQYKTLEKQEARHFRGLSYALEDYPIYTEFLRNVDGVGPAMAGVIISEIDITKATYSSSLWAYAGLDTVMWFELKQRYHDDAPARLYRRHPEGDFTTFGPKWMELGYEFLLTRKSTNEKLGTYGLPDLGEATEKQGWGTGRSRKKESLVERSYINKDKELASRVGITFNPFLKTKLMGVLAGCFLRAGNEKYGGIYRAYKERIEQVEKWKEKTKGHRNNAAQRYMMKQFLVDLYVKWRTIEGLEVHPSYQEAKFGHADKAA